MMSDHFIETTVREYRELIAIAGEPQAKLVCFDEMAITLARLVKD
jgi:hypothetical protein